jgi:hydrogenase maturation protease
MSVRIIGCGNPHGMDDAAGVLVAQRLREMRIPAEIQSGGAFELVGSWNEADDMILIDAVVTDSPVGSVHVWDGNPPRVPSNSQLSSHGFGVAEAINLGRILKLLPRTLRVYGIEGKEFGMGESVSPEVLRGVEEVAQQIALNILQSDKTQADLDTSQHHSLQISNSRS